MSDPNANFSLDDGDAFLSLSLPPEAKSGDRFTIESRVDDPTLVEPFVSHIRLTVTDNRKRKGGQRTKKGKPGAGTGKLGKGKGITLPTVVSVHEGDENWRRHNFDSSIACHVLSEPIRVNGKDTIEHIFYINLSNTCLHTEMKYQKADPRTLEAKFKYGNVLLGLAMLHDDENNRGNRNDQEKESSVQEQIRLVTSAVSPVLLPMIDQLSGLSDDEIESFGMMDEE